jgi:hypothetical protein
VPTARIFGVSPDTANRPCLIPARTVPVSSLAWHLGAQLHCMACAALAEGTAYSEGQLR